MVHEIAYAYTMDERIYECLGCQDVYYTLPLGIKHVVENQFVVEPPKHDSSNLKLGRSRNPTKYP